MEAGDRADPSLPRRRRTVPLLAALGVMTVAATVLGIMVANRPAMPESAGAQQSARSPTPEPRPSPPPLPNDGWFIPAPNGMVMRANEVIEDPDMLPLYLDESQADAIVASGVRRVRMRSYYAGATGGGAFKVMEVDDPAELLRRLRRGGAGRREPLPDLPEEAPARTAPVAVGVIPGTPRVMPVFAWAGSPLATRPTRRRVRRS